MHSLVLKRGDLLPTLKLKLTDGFEADGVTPKPVDLTVADLIQVIGWRENALLFQRTVTGGADGLITMPWQAADTDTAGDLLVEVQVTWPGGLIQTFPPDDYNVVRIVQDLG